MVNLPGAYLSTNLDSDEKAIMVLHGCLLELMALANKTVYRPYIITNTYENMVLYV